MSGLYRGPGASPPYAPAAAGPRPQSVAQLLRVRLQVPPDLPDFARRRSPAARRVVGTVDLLYSKNVNQLYVQDANLVNLGRNCRRPVRCTAPSGTSSTGAFVATPSRITPSSGPDAIGAAVLHTNTPLGRTYSGTVQLQKSFSSGLEVNAGYTYSNTKDAISLTSSQAFSNFQFAAVDGPLESQPDDLVLRHSPQGHAERHRQPAVSHRLSLIYIGRSGDPYAWIVNGDVNADGINGNDLPFIPADASQITLPPDAVCRAGRVHPEPGLPAGNPGTDHGAELLPNPWQNYLNARLGGMIPTSTPGPGALARSLQRAQLHRSRLGTVQAGERVRGRPPVPEQQSPCCRASSTVFASSQHSDTPSLHVSLRIVQTTDLISTYGCANHS